MVGLASRRARRAGALAAAVVGLCVAWPAAAAKAKPKPEPDSEDVTFEVTDPGPKGKGKAKAKRSKPAKKAAPQPTPKAKKPKAQPATKPVGGGKAKAAEPDSDDVVLTTTTADGTKVEEIVLEEEEDAEPPLEADEPPPSKAKQNWVGLHFQQDSMIFSSVKNVCPSVTASGTRVAGDPDFSCRDADGVYGSRVYAGAGNQVNGGFGLASTRLMLGYDRVLIDRVTAGARLGYAFRNAPTVAGVSASIPVHAELRGAYHFLGARPFEEGGLHPFAGLGLGFAEVDAVVSVDFYKDAADHAAKKSSRLHAWRRTGTGFAAPTVGATYGVAGLLFSAELRTLIMFPASGTSVSLGLGVAYGL
jgi:hypothetical protein